MKSRILPILFGCFALIFAFQNCSHVEHSGPETSVAAKDNGDPYYGKPYENGTGCSGTDPVRARILYVSASEAYLTKDNCQTLNPATALTPTEFHLDSANPNLLEYRGLTFVTPQQAVLAQETEGSLNPGGKTITTNLKSPTASGNLLVCFLIYQTSSVSVTSLSDSQGKAFMRAVAPTPTVGVASGAMAEAWYSENNGGGATSVTAQFSGSVGSAVSMVCSEFSGVKTSGALDAAATSSGLTSNGTAVVGPVATNAVDDLLVSAVWHDGSVPTPGAGFSLISNYSSDIYMYGNSADPGNYTATASNVGDWLGFILAFKTK